MFILMTEAHSYFIVFLSEALKIQDFLLFQLHRYSCYFIVVNTEDLHKNLNHEFISKYYNNKQRDERQ